MRKQKSKPYLGENAQVGPNNFPVHSFIRDDPDTNEPRVQSSLHSENRTLHQKNFDLEMSFAKFKEDSAKKFSQLDRDYQAMLYDYSSSIANIPYILENQGVDYENVACIKNALTGV